MCSRLWKKPPLVAMVVSSNADANVNSLIRTCHGSPLYAEASWRNGSKTVVDYNIGADGYKD